MEFLQRVAGIILFIALIPFLIFMYTAMYLILDEGDFFRITMDSAFKYK